MVVVVMVFLLAESVMAGFVPQFPAGNFPILDIDHSIFRGPAKVLADGLPIVGDNRDLHLKSPRNLTFLLFTFPGASSYDYTFIQ
jgi:hypothetical protein